MLIKNLNNRSVIIAKERALYKFLRYHKHLEPIDFRQITPDDNKTYPVFPNIEEVRDACKEYEDTVFRTKKKGLINFLVENKYKPFCTIHKKVLVESDGFDDADLIFEGEIVDLTIWYVIVDDYARELIKDWRNQFK